LTNATKDLTIETLPTLKKKSEVPVFKTQIQLSPQQKKEIYTELKAELDAINKEYEADRRDKKYDALDQQYKGEMRQIPGMQFNVSRKITSVKINAICRALLEAYFESDHVFSISPRPEYESTDNGKDVCERLEDFLDHKVDERIPLEEAMSLVFHHAALKGNSVLKIIQRYVCKRRKMEEEYGVEDFDPTNPESIKEAANEAQRFLTNYPDAQEKYSGILKNILLGKKQHVLAEYDEVVYDDPYPKYVDIKNFRVRKNVNGLDGLRDAYMVFEKKEYTYWQLIQEEKEQRLFDIAELFSKKDADGKSVKIDNYANETYVLWEAVAHVKIKGEGKEGEDNTFGGAEDFIRCVFHFSYEKETLHGADYYPYWAIDTYYLPFSLKYKEPGFYQPGVGEDLTDLHLAGNMFLNFMLEGAWISNTVTPIVKRGSLIANQFAAKSWNHGMPLEIETKADTPDFLSKYSKPSNSSEFLTIMQSLDNQGGDVSGISESFATGRADPIDPSAPAMKTRDLLAQSGINIKDYIKRVGMTFNEIGNVIVQMYSQRGQAVKYRLPEDKQNGSSNPFATLSRADLAARVLFRNQAMIFDIDKLNAKKEDIALWQVLRSEPLIARNEEAVYQIIKTIVKGWSPKWRASIKKILPNPTEFQKQRLMVAVQAVGAYIEMMNKQAQIASVQGQQAPADVDPAQLLAAIDTYLKQLATMPSEQEAKMAEQAEKEGVPTLPPLQG
jgi:hypothetical protein